MHFCIVGYNSLNQGCGFGTETSKLRLWLQATKVFGSSTSSKNDLVHWKLKTMVLFVQLYYYTSIDEVSRNDIFDG